MSDVRTLAGGCLCGAVRYELDYRGEEGSTCHCTMCRRQSGGAFMGFVTVPRSSLRMTGAVRFHKSSAIGRRGFCPECGTPLIMDYAYEDDLTGVVTGSLDDPDAVPPTVHWGVESKLAWLKLDDGLPQLTTEQDPAYAAALKRIGGKET